MAGSKTKLAIALCKAASRVGSLVGRGSSMPGSLALKVCPDILSRIELPETVIAVTGSNGKTSTVEMIAHILTSDGHRVAWNKAGSNQTEGVATCLLCDCTSDG
jgi:UDP-N-acetylmuramyl tripeptide synthase